MEFEYVKVAVENLEKANANYDSKLFDADGRSELLAAYAKAEKLAAYGRTQVAAEIDDAAQVARATGTSLGKARAALDTGRSLQEADEVREAFKSGELSLDQATEVAKAEQASPGSSSQLLRVAEEESFQVLREKSRRVVLEAEQHRGLAERQHQARSARSHRDDLGMVNINLVLEPHVGSPIVNRAEAEASRLYRAAKKSDGQEPFERLLADAYAGLLSGGSSMPSRRPELVVLVSHEIATRGWKDVREGEVCKIPGVGPVSPQVAKEIAADAFLTGVFYDGKDLRSMHRWTRNTPVEVRLALELGEPPEYDGVKCRDCGGRFRTEYHLEPHVAFGFASTGNLVQRCYSCHKAKTEQDRKAGKLTPRNPAEDRAPPGR